MKASRSPPPPLSHVAAVCGARVDFTHSERNRRFAALATSAAVLLILLPIVFTAHGAETREREENDEEFLEHMAGLVQDQITLRAQAHALAELALPYAHFDASLGCGDFCATQYVFEERWSSQNSVFCADMETQRVVASNAAAVPLGTAWRDAAAGDVEGETMVQNRVYIDYVRAHADFVPRVEFPFYKNAPAGAWLDTSTAATAVRCATLGTLGHVRHLLDLHHDTARRIELWAVAPDGELVHVHTSRPLGTAPGDDASLLSAGARSDLRVPLMPTAEHSADMVMRVAYRGTAFSATRVGQLVAAFVVALLLALVVYWMLLNAQKRAQMTRLLARVRSEEKRSLSQAKLGYELSDARLTALEMAGVVCREVRHTLDAHSGYLISFGEGGAARLAMACASSGETPMHWAEVKQLDLLRDEIDAVNNALHHNGDGSPPPSPRSTTTASSMDHQEVSVRQQHLLHKGQRIGNFHALLVEVATPAGHWGSLLLLRGRVFAEVERAYVEQSSTVLRRVVEREQREKAKTDFLSFMSHEMRTPIHGIAGAAELLKTHPLGMEEEHYVNMIGSAATILHNVVNSVLDYAKLDEGMMRLELRPVQLPRMLSTVVDILVQHEKHTPGVEVRFEVDDNVPPLIVCDETRLQQVLLNFGSNAVKFTTQGSVCVRVALAPRADAAMRVPTSPRMRARTRTSARRAVARGGGGGDTSESDDEAGAIRLGGDDAASDTPTHGQEIMLLLSVVDTGKGMKQADTARMFERFTQADVSVTREFGGTGLGLAISKGIVQLWDGDINVESELGKGSTFSFTMPTRVATCEEEAEINFDLSAHLLRGRGHRRTSSTMSTMSTASSDGDDHPLDSPGRSLPLVLLVDDDPTNLEVMAHLLEQIGVAVVTAESGMAAKREFAELERCDLVLMDYVMEEVDGIEATRLLRGVEKMRGTGQRPVPVVCISADQQARQKCAATMDEVVMKPISLSSLRKLCTRYISQLRRRQSRRSSRLLKPATSFNEGTRGNVLVVDDEKLVRTMSKRQVQRLGYEVTAVASGEAALEALTDGGGLFTHVLLDRYMELGQLDGVETARRIRAMEASEGSVMPLRIIGVTGAGTEEEVQSFRDAGIDLVLLKPFKMDALEKAL